MEDIITTTDQLAELEAVLQVSFHDRSLLLRAITHHTFCSLDTAVQDSYDTLEFLGDAIIGSHVVEHIYRTFPHASAGEMTILKSEVVSRRILARAGQQLGLFPFIRVNTEKLRTFNDRSRDSLCADVLEAIVGAIQIDQGSEAAGNFVARIVLPMVEQVKPYVVHADPKGRLQKIIAQRYSILPIYRVLEKSGPQSDNIFTVGVFVHNELLGVGKGSSIKEAGREAAYQALKRLH